MTDKDDKELHARFGLIDPRTGEQAKLYPGDPGYDNIPPTSAQVAHYHEQTMSAKELREHREAEKRADESLRKTVTQSTGTGDKK